MFAYKPSPDLNPRSAFSGRISESTLSHFGPPTAPNSTASLSFADSIVSCGSGMPNASIAAPPALSSLVKISISFLEAAASNTSIAAVVISGPIPSPGITAILYFLPIFPSLILQFGLRITDKSAVCHDVLYKLRKRLRSKALTRSLISNNSRIKICFDLISVIDLLCCFRAL